DGKKIVSKLKDTQKPFTEPEKEKPSEPPATTERSKNLISTLTQDENQNDVIKKIRTLIQQGTFTLRKRGRGMVRKN
ncbi:hypothetical protein QOZ30_29085, partial [Pseudomonas aeruginosa]|uniref:hypothetical protein n=1 Tax=Pseudomonas aeruginosa TaxID=287 RepID=UPI00345970D9